MPPSCAGLLALAVCFSVVAASVDFCSVDRFNLTKKKMQFTKELNDREFAIQRKFKSLHCCARSYRSIEWFKDGRPYPWPSSMSSFILYPESGNQTIYTQTVQDTDVGNYTCVVRNDTMELQHSMNVNLIERGDYTGPPRTTYQPKNTVVQFGQEKRLFCEAFVGRIDLPDAHNEVGWFRNKSDTLSSVGFKQHNISREDDVIIGSYLIIEHVKQADLGEYTCRISNAGFQTLEMSVKLLEFEEVKISEELPKVAYKRLILTLGLICLAAVTLIALYYQYALRVRLIIKDTFYQAESDDGKDYDVLVCYDDKDSEVVLGMLIPVLENQFGYHCYSQALVSPAANNTWLAELDGVAQRSRRLLVILSPSLVQDVWTSAVITNTLHLLLSVHPRLVCIALQILPKENAAVKNEHGESLRQLVKTCNIVVWEGNRNSNRKDFWTTLRLHLPPRHPQNIDTGNRQPMTHISVTGVPANISGKKRAHRSDSQESLEVLV